MLLNLLYYFSRIIDLIETQSEDLSSSSTCFPALTIKVEFSPQRAKLTKDIIILEENGNPENYIKIILHARVLGLTYTSTLKLISGLLDLIKLIPDEFISAINLLILSFLGKGKGTPMLKSGIHCVDVLNDPDESDAASDWQGFS